MAQATPSHNAAAVAAAEPEVEDVLEASAAVAAGADTDRAWVVAAVDIGQAWAAVPADRRFRPARGLRRSAGLAARALIRAALQEETGRASEPARAIDRTPAPARGIGPDPEWAVGTTPVGIGRVVPGPASAAIARALEREETGRVLALGARAGEICQA